jgi:hypothetical protein
VLIRQDEIEVSSENLLRALGGQIKKSGNSKPHLFVFPDFLKTTNRRKVMSIHYRESMLTFMSTTWEGAFKSASRFVFEAKK